MVVVVVVLLWRGMPRCRPRDASQFPRSNSTSCSTRYTQCCSTQFSTLPIVDMYNTTPFYQYCTHLKVHNNTYLNMCYIHYTLLYTITSIYYLSRYSGIHILQYSNISITHYHQNHTLTPQLPYLPLLSSYSTENYSQTGASTRWRTVASLTCASMPSR